MGNKSRKRRNKQGFTLIEVVLTFSILAIATIALGLVEVSNARRTQDLKERDIAFARGQAFMERILRMPFGPPNPSDMTAEEYDRLFGSDDDVRTVSLTQLEQKDENADGFVDGGPIRFKLEGVEDSGTWEVFVDGDLDGNGVIEDTVAGVPTREGRGDLLRIEIRRNGRTVLKTLRARTPQERDEQDSLN